MAKVLVTGAKGQLGSSIRAVAENVSGMDFLFTDLPETDLTRPEEAEQLIQDSQPEYVVNCAAYTDVDSAESNVDTAYLINRDVPAQLGMLSDKYGFRLIHLSTDYVFSGTSLTPYAETDIPAPSSVYGKSKLAGEKALEGSSAIIIRTAWLYSTYGQNFVKTILNLTRQKDEIRVVYDQIGTPTYAPDLADVILTIIEKSVKGTGQWNPGIFHYSNEGVCSWFDMAYEIRQAAGSSCKVLAVRSEEFQRPAPRPAFSLLGKEKIKSTFNITIPYWRDSLNLCMKTLI